MPPAGLLLALFAAAPAASASTCPLTIRFASHAMGIDRVATDRIDVLLRSSRQVTAIERRPWGMEGEYDLCVRLRRGADAAAMARRLKALVPPKPRGPVSIRLDPRDVGGR